MQPIASVGDVRDADALCGRQQVLETNRDECAQGNLKRPAADVHIGALACRRMQIEPVAAHAHGVRERLSPFDRPSRFDPHMLLEHRELRLDAPALAHVHMLGGPVARTDDIVTQAQSAVTGAAVMSRGLCLHPVQERQAELAGPLDVAAALFLGDTHEGA
jgi:hypothetical protein